MISKEAGTKKLLHDLKAVITDAEELLKTTANDVGDKARLARERLTSVLTGAKDSYETLEEKTACGVKTADRLVQEHPYESIGIAFGTGLLLGIMLVRRK